ncbi:sugar ABC transporter ATP-binding protein [Pelosinus sp. UFO1]|uniref:sugar ABC transporter ATP-binding protein n=1 Tax=Pelosinus sp. UFO1 TaxID=484770 RepID=UPI0004D0CF0C|nr:sugar ABC transporter ATP-binding protein [Pelosinus sp. UFO1]AIF53002.1 Monosaccharide-transporting ATPase [Pelosinus sp. UFO1]
MDDSLVLQMGNIKKAFNTVTVLKGVTLELKKGEIHALLGENGAGKSTLMNILGGVIKKDEGHISIGGEKAEITSPSDAKRLGISFIHQELNLINDLKVYENLFLGTEKQTSFGLLDKKFMVKATKAVLQKIDPSISAHEYIQDMDNSRKQTVEIARALLADAKIIIMDEPTTSLSEQEIDRLFSVMRSLKKAGVGIIFISHKLKEVLTICDTYTVLRDGVVTGNGAICMAGEEDLARLMVGKDVLHLEYYIPAELGEPLLAVKNLTRERSFRNINFMLQKGEIIGFTGLLGDGRSELFECIFGCSVPDSGQVFVKGQEKHIKSPGEALAAGIGLVPRNRKENAIIKDLSVMQNLTISSLGKVIEHGLINEKREKEKCKEYVKQLNIKVSDINAPITSLSGGNQQKVILGKWIEVGADIIILDNPTQGVDIGAKSEIYQMIVKLARAGKGIIVLSAELPEIMKVCDRVFVMYHGEIRGELDRNEMGEEQIMMLSTGVK